MGLLSARLVSARIPVFRYDRRGIGDSSGVNTGFEHSGVDMAAAVATFRKHCPHLTTVVGFGNCDAATALALFHRDAGIDSLVLANPWTSDRGDDLPPPAAIRARYVERLKDPATYLRLLRGGVDLRKLMRGLVRLSAARHEPPPALVAHLQSILLRADRPIRVILAKGDATALEFAASPAGRIIAAETIDTDSHSFARGEDQAALEKILLTALA
jgi:pimeloyl-ACP methyl ester carboxylesterase